MKDKISIGLPSKGRLRDKTISFFNKSGLKILQSEKERNYFGNIENNSNIKLTKENIIKNNILLLYLLSLKFL